MGVQIIKWQTRAVYGCLVTGQSPVAAGLAYAVCDTTVPLQPQLPLAVLYKSYAFTSLPLR